MAKLVFFSLLAVVSFSSLQAAESICVLNYERRFHPFTKVIDEVFKNDHHIILKNEAIPLDFLNCIKEGVSEITIIAHSFQIDQEGEKFRLGYYKEVSPERREEMIETSQFEINERLNKIHTELTEHRCPQYVASGEGLPTSKRNRCRNLLREKRNARKEFAFVEGLDENYPLYDKKLFYNRIFSKSLDFLRAREQSGQDISLKSIRFMGCTPEEILLGHPPLKELISEFNLGLDIAPKQNLMSWMRDKDVTTIDKRWLEESAQFDSEEFDDEGFYAYIKLKTFLLRRSGSTKALRGKYEIKVKGLAMGFASKWSSVFIRYKDVEGMAIGEKRKIHLPQLDLQLALWMNAEIQLGRASTALGTSEINSLGVSLGLFELVEIERLY